MNGMRVTKRFLTDLLHRRELTPGTVIRVKIWCLGDRTARLSKEDCCKQCLQDTGHCAPELMAAVATDKCHAQG